MPLQLHNALYKALLNIASSLFVIENAPTMSLSEDDRLSSSRDV